MIEPTNQLIFEVLKSIQVEVHEVRQTLADHGQQFISIRDQIHTMNGSLQSQVHDLQGDILRLEKGQLAIVRDVDRIKRRLDLVDAE